MWDLHIKTHFKVKGSILSRIVPLMWNWTSMNSFTSCDLKVLSYLCHLTDQQWGVTYLSCILKSLLFWSFIFVFGWVFPKFECLVYYRLHISSIKDHPDTLVSRLYFFIFSSTTSWQICSHPVCKMIMSENYLLCSCGPEHKWNCIRNCFDGIESVSKKWMKKFLLKTKNEITDLL